MKPMRLPSFFGLMSSPGSRPMSRDKADTLLLLVSCTLVLAPHAVHLPLWVTPVCALLLIWRGWATFRGNRMPPRWLLLPLAIMAMAGVFVTYKTFFGREAGVAMLSLLLALKLLEMHAKRDLFVVVFLSFFLILTSFFYSQSIFTALLTIVAVVAILTTQLSFHYVSAVPPLRQRLKLGASILALAAPLTLVLFLLFPRIQGPLWGLPGDAQQGRTGMSDTMAPGNISQLALSDDIAFRAKFSGPVPAQAMLYWRGPVLGDFDGRTWTRLQHRLDTGRPIAVMPHGQPLRYQVTLEPQGQRWLFALDVPTVLPKIDGNPAGVSGDLELQVTNPIHDRLRYDAVSQTDYELQADEPPIVLRQWLRLPVGFNPQTLELATRLRRQTPSNTALIQAVLRMFREENFRYTLEPPPLGRNGIDDFLFATRAGFCEHYSGAFVVLMRAAGIPSRVVTGYQGGELNPADGYLAIRQSDAHAWAEVWLQHRGWVRIDPTAAVAPNRVEHNLGNVLPRRFLGGLITLDGSNQSWLGQLQRLRQHWDAVNNAWNQWVLNYTPDKQKNFVKSLGFNNVDWHTLTGIMVVAGMIVMAVTVLPLIRNRPHRDRLDAMYAKLCRRLARRGLPRERHEGPRAYAQRLCADASSLPPQKKAAVQRFLQLYETLRYGGPLDAPPAALSTLKSLLSECR